MFALLVYANHAVLRTWRGPWPGYASGYAAAVMLTSALARCAHHILLSHAAGEGAGLGQEVMEMLKKMKAQEYHLPDSLNLTPECKALLRALLHPESDKRVKMAGIMADAWFRTDLPPDALNMNDKYLANTRPCPQSEADIKHIVAMATNYNTSDMYASQMDQF
jgi:hypothetical protein